MAIRWDAQARLTGVATAERPGRLPGPLGRRLGAVRAVAFDLDSTLVDFVRWKRRACEGAVRALIDAGVDLAPGGGPPRFPEQVLAERLMDTYYEIGVESDEAIARFLSSVGGVADPRLVAVGVAGYLRGKATAMEPYPRTVPTLVSLLRLGHRLAVVTDAPRAKAWARLSATGLLPFFDTVVTRDDVGSGKDTEAPFHELTRRLACGAHEVLMVGDWPAKDVRHPKRLGMVTAWARYGAQPAGATVDPADQADLVLERIDDLTRIFDTLRVEHGVRP